MTARLSGPVRLSAPRWALALLPVAIVLLLPSRAAAIPSFARQFAVKCGTCHSPMPPRLNTTGLTFKRMGFRLPDFDDTGKLILKAKPSRSVTDDFSLLGDFHVENHRDEPTTFTVDSLMARGGGTVGNYFSYAGEVMWSNDAFSLDNLEAQVLLGQPNVNVTTRFGVLSPLIWERSDHAIGVSTPLLLSTPVAVGDFGGSATGDTRNGIELGLNFNHSGEHSTHNTYLGVSVFNRLGPGDPGFPAAASMGGSQSVPSTGGLKDVLVQGVHVFGYSNTLGALWYHGNVFNVGPSGLNDQTDRVALMGNYRLPTETDIVAGVGFGRDQPRMTDLRNVDSRGWFVEADQTVVSDTVVLFRFDRFDPDRLDLGMRVQGPTIGVSHLLLMPPAVAVHAKGGHGVSRQPPTSQIRGFTASRCRPRVREAPCEERLSCPRHLGFRCLRPR